MRSEPNAETRPAVALADADTLPSVSVIIPSRSVTPELRETLGVLGRLRPGPQEILVLPDAETAEAFPGVRFLPTVVANPCVKRNRALAEARGEIIAFLDDDAYPSAGWLPHALRHFRDPSVVAVGGPGVTPPHDPVWAKVSGAVLTSWLGSGPARCRYWPVGGVRPVDDWQAVNLLVRRAALERIGGLDTSFWPGEDTKLCLDLLRGGGTIRYDPRVVVYHHRATTPMRHLRQVGRYGLHRGHFARVLPKTSRRLVYVLPTFSVLALVALAGVTWVVPAARPHGTVLLALALMVMAAFGLVEATRVREWRVALFFPFLLIGTHLVYGLAFLRGVFAPRLKHYQRAAR